jgi:superfamily II DNA/RNA helicase
LVNQTYEVYKKVVSHAPEYRICNLLDSAYDKEAQVLVTTAGKLLSYIKGRSPINLSSMKVFVLDEADNFFMEKQREEEIMSIHQAFQKQKLQVQYLFFSATYNEDVSERISNLVDEASQINLKQEQLKLDNVTQYYLKTDRGKKVDFLAEVFEKCSKKT